jgi:uncharacterized membrane protein YkoI
MGFSRIMMALAMVPAGVALVTGLPPAANARDWDDPRPDEVRRAVESGEIRSLADILKGLRGKLPGEIARVEIEHRGRSWHYEFRVVDNKGRLFDVQIDARSGEIEGIEEK